METTTGSCRLHNGFPLYPIVHIDTNLYKLHLNIILTCKVCKYVLRICWKNFFSYIELWRITEYEDIHTEDIIRKFRWLGQTLWKNISNSSYKPAGRRKIGQPKQTLLGITLKEGGKCVNEIRSLAKNRIR